MKVEGLGCSVWIDDSHSIIRRGIWTCLTAEKYNVVGESCALRPVPKVEQLDVLIFEHSCKGLAEALQFTAGRKVALVAMVRGVSDADVCRLLEAGVRGVLDRDELTAERLSHTMRAVRHGATAAPSELMVRALASARTSGATGAGGLNDREREVLRWLADGSDTLEIATGMSFSERTVKNVVHDIMMKLNCRTRAHAVALATRSGVI